MKKKIIGVIIICVIMAILFFPAYYNCIITKESKTFGVYTLISFITTFVIVGDYVKNVVIN